MGADAMKTPDDPSEDWLSRALRYLGYFLFGALGGLLPAAFLVAASPARDIAWKVPLLMVLGFGLVSCLAGILTRGRFPGWLLRCLGKHIDPP